MNGFSVGWIDAIVKTAVAKNSHINHLLLKILETTQNKAPLITLFAKLMKAITNRTKITAMIIFPFKDVLLYIAIFLQNIYH